jgi:predicted nucleotidyltransferase component of viral defense system
MNFVENMCTRPKKGQLKSLLNKKHRELTLFPEYFDYSKIIRFSVYDQREILSEKIRALLTREGIKARDFLDIFFISEILRIKPQDVETCALKK